MRTVCTKPSFPTHATFKGLGMRLKLIVPAINVQATLTVPNTYSAQYIQCPMHTMHSLVMYNNTSRNQKCTYTHAYMLIDSTHTHTHTHTHIHTHTHMHTHYVLLFAEIELT